MVEGCIAEAFACKKITNFTSIYFSCASNVNALTTWYHVVRDVPLSELSIFQWNGTSVGAPSAHYVTDKEWNYSMLYMYMNMEELELYFKKFDKIYWTSRNQPTLKQLNCMHEHGLKGGPSFLKWFLTTCNLSLHHFSFLILLHQSCSMCNVVYYFICSVWRMSLSTMT
jgi:hypothetical protein